MAISLNSTLRGVAVLCIFLAAGSARAESVTLYVPRESGAEPVAFEVLRPQETPYLSLGALAQALGGNVRILPARVQIDLGGHTAVAWVNGVRVSSSQGTFTLSEPLLRSDGDVLIAAADAISFFERAFLTSLQTEPPAAAEDLPRETPVRDLDELESALLPEPIEAPEPVEEIPAGQVQAVVGEMAEPAVQAPPIPGPATVPPPERPAPRAAGRIETVIIDAGHGGSEPGYAGQGGVVEKELTLAVAQALRRRLKETTGLKVFLTREDDRDRTLVQRVRRATEVEADLFISIHGGVSFSPRAHGFELFYAPDPPESQAGNTGIRFSRERSVRQPTAAQSRSVGEVLAKAMASSTSSESRGVKAAPIRLLQQLAVPGLLIEVGFLTNPAEEGLLATESYRLALAEGIADGLAAAAGSGEAAP